MKRDGNNEVTMIPFAIIVNPKLGVPVLCAITDTAARLDIELFSLSGTWLQGSILDFDDPVARASSFPRVHIEVRKEARGIGYGTVGYAAAAVAADLISRERLWTKAIESRASSMGSFYAGVSSMSGRRTAEADRWWFAAKKSGFATTKYGDVELEVDTSSSAGEWVLGTGKTSGKKITIDEASEAIDSLLRLFYQDLESVDLSSATISFRFEGTLTRNMKIDTLDSDEVFRRNLVLAMPRRFESYRTSIWDEPIYETQSPDNWEIVSEEALKNVNIASFKPVPFGELPSKSDPFPIGSREYAGVASWWMAMLASQRVSSSLVDRWRRDLSSFGASGRIGSKAASWQPPRAWADLP